MVWLQTTRTANQQELVMAKDALNWAAMTYVVAALSSLATLMYYVMLYLGRRD
jgi:Zn-dependent membrane protease YugP